MCRDRMSIIEFMHKRKNSKIFIRGKFQSFISNEDSNACTYQWNIFSRYIYADNFLNNLTLHWVKTCLTHEFCTYKFWVIGAVLCLRGTVDKWIAIRIGVSEFQSNTLHSHTSYYPWERSESSFLTPAMGN